MRSWSARARADAHRARAFQTDDAFFRGTALEYLDTVLPPTLLAKLKPRLGPPVPSAERRRELRLVRDDMLRVGETVALRLEDRRPRPASAVAGSPPAQRALERVPGAGGMMTRSARWLAGIELFIAVGAVCGGAALMADPSGRLLRMPLDLLAGAPFRTYLLPGVILAVVVGGSMLAAAIAVIRRARRAASLSVVAGGILVVWIGTQVALIGYRHPVQLVYLGLGIVVAALGVGQWRRRA